MMAVALTSGLVFFLAGVLVGFMYEPTVPVVPVAVMAALALMIAALVAHELSRPEADDE